VASWAGRLEDEGLQHGWRQKLLQVAVHSLGAARSSSSSSSEDGTWLFL
jgi:hypothetical protein